MKLSLGLSAPAASCAPGGAALSSDTSLATFLIEGIATEDEGTVNLGHGTTSVSITITPTHPGATVGSITGDTGLTTGENDLSFAVTAEDGVTTQEYNVTLSVAWANADGAGSLLGYTSAGSGAESPPPANVTATNALGGGVLRVIFNGTGRLFTFDTGDPGDGSVWIDITSCTTQAQCAEAFAAAIAATTGLTWGGAVFSSWNGDSVSVYTNNTGSSISLTVEQYSGTGWNISGGGNGADAAAPAGADADVEIVPAETGSAIRITDASWTASPLYGYSLDFTLGWLEPDSTFTALASESSAAANATGVFGDAIGQTSPPGASLVARSSDYADLGSEVTIYVEAERT